MAADPLTPGRFFVAVQGGCIYRTIDNAATWQKVYGKSATRIATDRATPNRAAASTHEGVVLSIDGGEHYVVTLNK